MNGSAQQFNTNPEQQKEILFSKDASFNRETVNETVHQIRVIAAPIQFANNQQLNQDTSQTNQDKMKEGSLKNQTIVNQNNGKQAEQAKETQDMTQLQATFNTIPRRRSLFGQQHDEEVKRNKKRVGSNKKSTVKSVNSRQSKRKSTLKWNNEEENKNGSTTPRVRLKLVNNILGEKLKKQQTLRETAAVGDGSKDDAKNGETQSKQQLGSSGQERKGSRNSLKVATADINPSLANISENINNSMTKKQVESQQSTRIANPYDEFTLDDLKILQETIQNNRQELEKELFEIQQQKKIKRQVTLQPQVAKKWEKVKNSLMAFTMMRKIFNDIKKYGTSMQALSITDQVIDKCRDLLESKLVKQQYKKYLFYPERSIFLTMWLPLMFLLYCITAIYSPYKIFFKPQSEMVNNNLDTLIIDYTLDCLFFLDILFKMNTAVVTNQGKLLESRKDIIVRYLKRGFILDLLQVIPFEVLSIFYPILDQQIIKTTSYNDIFRIIRIPFLMSKVTLDQKVFDYFKIQSTIQRLIRFFFAVCFTVHIVGCLWVFIARVQYYDRATWISENSIELSDSTKVYLFSVYWCMQTLATVGYGDIHASNDAEVVFAIFWMIIGAGFYSFAVGQLSKMFTNSESRKQKLTNSIYIMDEFCSQAMLPKHINEKIRKALQYSTNKSILSSTEKEDFFDSIPTKLKTTLAQGMFKGMIAAVPFLKNKDHIFLANLLPMLQPLKLSKGDFVYKKDSYPNLVYFIIDGKVNFLIGQNEMVFKSFLAGSYFGEIEIFHQCLRLFSVRCEQSCELLTLDRDYFGELMDKFPQVEQEMFEMVQTRQELMNESLQKIEMLLDLNENDNFWKNVQMKSFAEILQRRKTHSFLHNDSENHEHNNPNPNTMNQISSNNQLVNFITINTNNNMLSPTQTTNFNIDQENKTTPDNQIKPMSLTQIAPQNKNVNNKEISNPINNGNQINQNSSSNSTLNNNGSSNNIKFTNQIKSAVQQSAQQDNSLKQPTNSKQELQQINYVERENSLTSIGKQEKFQQDDQIITKSITVLKKTKIDYHQQVSGGSNSSSNHNLNQDQPSSQTIIPMLQSAKSLKNNNIVLNVFNEKQEAMLVEVYEEEIKSTKLLQSSTTQSLKNITDQPHTPVIQHSNSQNIPNNPSNNNGHGNIKRIQQKYGVSSLDRIEEKYSHVDIENLSNSYFTNQQPPSLVSLSLNDQKLSSIRSEQKKKDKKSASSSSSSGNEKKNKQGSASNKNKDNITINVPNQELEISVGSIKNLNFVKRQPNKRQTNGNYLTTENFSLDKSDNENAPIQQKISLKIQLSQDSIQENANLLAELLKNEKLNETDNQQNNDQNNQSIQNQDKLQSSTPFQVNQNVLVLDSMKNKLAAQNQQNQDQESSKNHKKLFEKPNLKISVNNNSTSTPDQLLSFGSKKESEIIDSPYQKVSSFSDAMKNLKIKQTVSLKQNSSNNDSKQLQPSSQKHSQSKQKETVQSSQDDQVQPKISNSQNKPQPKQSHEKISSKSETESISRIRSEIKRQARQRQDTLTIQQNLDQEQTPNKNIIFSDRLDKVYNITKQVTALNLQVQPTLNYDSNSVASSRKQSLQEIQVIDTSPENTPVHNRSRLSFQTRGSRQSIFGIDFKPRNSISQLQTNNLEVYNMRQNKFQRFQKTQTVLNTDSDEEKKKQLKNLRQTKTISNLTDMMVSIEKDTDEQELDYKEVPAKINQKQSNIDNNDFDIQSLHHLAKNDENSSMSDPPSPVHIKSILKDEDFTDNNRNDSPQLFNSEEPREVKERKKKKHVFAQKKNQTIEKSNHLQNIALTSQKSSKERRSVNVQFGRSKSNSSYKTDKAQNHEKKKVQKTPNEKYIQQKQKLKKSKKNSQGVKNSDGEGKDKKKKKMKTEAIFKEKTTPKNKNDDEKRSLHNITIHTELQSNQIESRNNLDRNKSMHSLNIQDMMKHIEDDFENENIKKTRNMIKKLTLSREFNENFEVNQKKNSKVDGDISSSPSSLSSHHKRKLSELASDNELKQLGTNEEKLDHIRRIRKQQKTQTNKFEDRIKILKQMGSIQISQASGQSPLAKQYKQSMSNSIFSPNLETPQNLRLLQHQQSGDGKVKNLSFSEMIADGNFVDSNHTIIQPFNSQNNNKDIREKRIKSLERDQLSHISYKSDKQFNDSSSPMKSKEKRELFLKQKHKYKSESTNRLNRIDRDNESSEMKTVVNLRIKKLQQSHQSEIKLLKQNTDSISNQLDSLTYQYENIVNLVQVLTNELQGLQEQEPVPKYRQIQSLPHPAIRKEINKSPLSKQDMEDIDNILFDLNIQSSIHFNPLSMRKRKSSTDSNRSARNAKRILKNLQSLDREDEPNYQIHSNKNITHIISNNNNNNNNNNINNNTKDQEKLQKQTNQF